MQVAEVKERIRADQGDAFPVERTLLIYQGKVLKDDTTLEESKVSQNTFLVVMVQKDKAKAAPPPKAAPSAAAAAPTPASTPTPTPQPSQPVAAAGAGGDVAMTPEQPVPPAQTPSAPRAAAPQTASTPASVEAPAGAAAAAGNQLLTGDQYHNNINQIMEMGFPREEVVAAMRAAFNNPERAVQYLTSGFPEGMNPAQQAASGASGGQSTGVATGAASGGAAGAGQGGQGPNAQPLDMFAPQAAGSGSGGAANQGALNFLRMNPQFQALRQVVQSNPGILQPMLQELSRNNPQLLQLINSNQAEFLRLINEAPGGDDSAAAGDAAALSALAGAGGGAGGEGGLPPGAVQIELTEDEASALERLQALGFERQMCLEAFLACDKNEELAANYLFENAGEDL